MRYICIAWVVCPALLLGQQNTSIRPNHTLNQLVGIDKFGRSFTTISGFKPKKQVGIFYWPWIGQPYASGVYDATIIGAMPDGLKLLYDFKSLNDSISPTGQAHFWGEPLWGYYNSEDEWVIRKQMKMLTMAGIDFIAFDLTNRVTYKTVYEKVFHVIEELIEEGWSPPGAVFYTHSRSFETTWQLYNELYKPNLYPGAWYRVNGKPMIIAYTKEADDIAEAVSRKDSAYRPVPYSQELKDFFYFKKPQWPFDPVYEDGLPWVEWSFPQPLHGGIMSVSVASHPKVPMSRSLTSGWVNWGRGWDPESEQNKKEEVDKGGFFQKQWDHALQVNPDTLFIGGWNEWIAYKQPWGDEYMLCDAADKEYSRDIEPMRGGYEDAFYIQLIKNIRQYKGLPDNGNGYPAKSIDISKSTNQWADVRAVYRNTDGKVVARNSYGVSQKVFYTLPAPVNNLKEVRVAHDAAYFYFLIQADKPFVHSGVAGGLQLLIGTNEPASGGWNGYEYIVELNGGKSAVLSRLDKQCKKAPIANIAFTIKNDLVQLRVPRRQAGGKEVKQIYFKVADGVARPEDIMEYYISGSVMPMGRLSYLYRIQN
ncbi:MAG: hypothetical protein KF746_00545 [Chitinophagaceae bacterium]|nr:hypothetical protein [Chitinophagaceae bacterium]